MVGRVALLLLLAAVAAPPAAAAPRLKAFDSCGALIRYAQRHADRIPDPRRDLPPEGMPVPVSAPEAGDDHSSTNVQEGGVDEADSVKTDGRRLFVVAGGSLHAIDARAATPRVLSSLALPASGFEHELLVHRDRLLVISRLGGVGIPEPNLRLGLPLRTSTQLSEVHVTDAGELRLVRTLETAGSYLSARLTGPTARVVIASVPERGAEGTMPRGTLERAGREPSVRRLVRCRAVRRPRVFSGLEMVTVLTIDLERGLPAVDSDAVMASADTVYASPRSLYVSTRRWIDAQSTAIHRFDASERGRTAYRSSGAVRGSTLSQWALSEHDGHLRVATTEDPELRDSESQVTVLRERDRRLVEVGRVGGLGHGERIHGVRFIGDLGYVVTFRRIDPLYVVGLGDPERPRLLGELKILGYSAYLHPVGDDLLLGVGQDATAEGRIRGTQLSLFDVSDPRRPRRLHQQALAPGSSSAVEWDHRAFLHWPRTGLAVLPVDTSAAGFRVARRGIEPVGAASQQGVITRSAVIGDRLFTVSDSGVTASPLSSLRGGAWLPFGQGAP